MARDDRSIDKRMGRLPRVSEEEALRGVTKQLMDRTGHNSAHADDRVNQRRK